MLKSINWRYAIGEIIIVIIGITIAFTLNKYAENAKHAIDKQKYLESLIGDLDNEMLHLNNNTEKFQQKIADIKGLFPYLNGKMDGRDTIVGKVFGLAEIIHFQPNDITYKTLINSGDLGLFDNFELKKELENHYSDQTLIEMDYKRQNNIHEKYFGDFMIHHIDFDQVRKGNYSFIDDKLLKNIIQSLYGTYMIAITTSEKGVERCQKLKEVLEEEVKN
ncbi:MAG: hypothetical protein DHS20C18_25550 [Saprospiraceae bacterium]|nr:MAG: hypothetical protein DHS20C18_25550 [Saprospiraceae bacterium]